MFLPQFKVKRMFIFDRGIRKTDWRKINESPLKRAGLLARRIERGLIRKDITKKQTPSRPGRPPKSRHPLHLFRQIYSVPNILGSSVVVGHERLTAKRQTVMEIHEFGQRVPTQIIIPPKKNPLNKIKNPVQRAKVHQMFKQGKLKSKPLSKQVKTVKMPERPFAKPTTQRVAARMPPLWRNSVGNIAVKS